MIPLPPQIELRGVRVHNLKGIDLNLPLGRLIVITGVSGAGKSSLAFDTLYAEGQRRYVESFSTYSRQFLERLEQPAADSIGRLPPAVAVRQSVATGSRRATLASATEVLDYLRLLLARGGEIVCPRCGVRVERSSPAGVARIVADSAVSRRLQVAFPIIPRRMRDETGPADAVQRRLAHLARAGFSRAMVGRESRALADIDAGMIAGADVALVIVDRLQAPIASVERLTDSLETAFHEGMGSCVVLVEGPGATGDEAEPNLPRRASDAPADAEPAGARLDRQIDIDGRSWRFERYDTDLVCAGCGREFAITEPALFDSHSPLGACPACGGTGIVEENETPTVCRECNGARLRPMALAVRVGRRNLPELTALTVTDALDCLGSICTETAPEGKGTGKRPGVDEREAPAGEGTRAVSVLRIDQSAILSRLMPPVLRRLEFLRDVGLGYLTLDRPLRTLSRGEAQRARLAGACGSNLVNLLYVLDEPTTGLHPRDTERLLEVLLRLRDAGNTVVVVEHDPAAIRRADLLVDLGPLAGKEGGHVVYQGLPAAIVDCADSVTGDFISGRRRVIARDFGARRTPTGWIRLAGIRHHNLQGVSVAVPLGVLCVVSGVSGSGKSSLVVETLLPAVSEALHARTSGSSSASLVPLGSGGGDVAGRATLAPSTPALPPQGGEGAERRAAGRNRRGAHRSVAPDTVVPRFASLSGAEQLDDILFIDAQPIGRSPRSLPASFLGIMGEIRTLFAGTAEAKVKNFSARHFGFYAADGGRCGTCEGAGSVAVDMRFLPDVVVTCPDCGGTRYRREVLEVKYRGLSIAEVLALTAQEAFTFFRGRTRLQRVLKHLKDAGLEYIQLGQPARTLSGGESQRLKLAACLARGTRTRTLIVLEEPTTGLHPQDVGRLLACWNFLLAAGHSLVVIEHDLDVIRAADHVIDLGPEAGERGGQVVAAGTPEEIAGAPQSITGRYLG